MKTNYGSMNFGDWIKCADRLPETGTYLCTMSGELIGSSEPFTGMAVIVGALDNYRELFFKRVAPGLIERKEK